MTPEGPKLQSSVALAPFLDECSSVATLIVDADRRVVQTNNAYRRMAERQEGDVGELLADLVLPESRAALDRLLKGDSPAERILFQTADGSPFLLTCRVYREGEHGVLLGETYTLTETEVLRTLSGLNQEVATLARDLERKNRELRWALDEHERAEALREADHRKDQFLAMLSHELRNPLAPIRNGLYILERASPSGEQARRAREVINRQVTHLARLVDDLLDVTRIARSKIRLQRSRLDLVDLVHRT
ncbi:MAG: PAS domain-containing protein, partial [Deltaproteobacteria bacterium]|nr:PAS domain-containing protein [Deltaproteobacteria bacterium]